MNTNTEIRDLIITAAMEIHRINPALTPAQCMDRAAAYTAHQIANERPTLAARLLAAH